MKLISFMTRRKFRRFVIVVWGLTLVILIGCAARESKLSPSAKKETSMPRATPTMCEVNCPNSAAVQISPEFQHDDETTDCSSSVYLIPTSTISNVQRINADWQGPENRFDKQGDWLSLHLELSQDVVQLGKPIPLLLTFTNKKDDPVIFARPQYIVFQSEHNEINQVSRLVVDVNSTSGNKLPLDLTVAEVLRYIPPPVQEFSRLAPGQSCNMKMSLDWNATALTKPIPPGRYTLRAHSEHFDPGPRVSDGGSEIWNIDAWVGYTGPSNAVIFTVLPEK